MKEVQINESSKFAVMTTHPAFQTIIFVLTRYFAIIIEKQREKNVTERERQEEREKEQNKLEKQGGEFEREDQTEIFMVLVKCNFRSQFIERV